MKVFNSFHDLSKDICYFDTWGPLLRGEKLIESQKIWDNILWELLSDIARMDLELGRLFWIFLAENDFDVFLNVLNCL